MKFPARKHLYELVRSFLLHCHAIVRKEIQIIALRARAIYETQVKRRVLVLYAIIMAELVEYPDKKERVRRLILFFAFLFFLDYLMYCLHTDKNIVDFFPEIPSLTQDKSVFVYLPDPDGTTIHREKRSIPVYDSDERTAKRLFDIVVKGSIYENTSMAVPCDLFVRTVWIYRRGKEKTKLCVFDCEPAELRSNAIVIPNSERLFKQALEKTIIENIPAIKTVLVLEKGVPGNALWDL